MRLWQPIASLAIMCSATAGAQPHDSSAGPQLSQVQVYTPGPDVTTPEITPFNVPFLPPKRCDEKVDGKVTLSLLVDVTGHPQDIMFVHPLANDLDRFALQIADADRFKPGTHEGVAVPVAVSLEIGIKSCVEDTEDRTGKKNLSLRMRSLPEQKLGSPTQTLAKAIIVPIDTPEKDAVGSPHTEHKPSRVSAPVPLNSVIAQYTPEALNARINGHCLVSVIVDVHGMPQNPRIVKGLGHGLDENALIAVNKYRFRPAMKDGTPVPVAITVEVNFRVI